MKEYEILDVHAVEILDSRGLPTVDVTITLKMVLQETHPFRVVTGSDNMKQLNYGMEIKDIWEKGWNRPLRM